MRTRTTMMFGQIAVVTEHLKGRISRETTRLQLPVEIDATRAAAHGLPMCFSVSIDMIDGQKPEISLVAAGTPAAVGSDSFLPHVLVGADTISVPFLFAALAVNTSIILAKILAATCTQLQTALFRVMALITRRLFPRAAGAASSLPLWRKLISTGRTEAIGPALIVLFSLAFGRLGHVFVPPLSIVPYREPNHKGRGS